MRCEFSIRDRSQHPRLGEMSDASMEAKIWKVLQASWLDPNARRKDKITIIATSQGPELQSHNQLSYHPKET